MSWASIAIPAVMSLMSSMNSGGGNQTSNQTANRSPWAPVAPWLTSNIQRGQALQNYYQNNPFSPSQQQAFGNQFALSNAYRSMLPSLASGLNTGTFNRTSPLQRPQMQNFSLPASQNLGFVSTPDFGALTQATASPAPVDNTPKGLTAADVQYLQNMIADQQKIAYANSTGS